LNYLKEKLNNEVKIFLFKLLGHEINLHLTN